MKTRTVEEFKAAVKQHNITRWPIRNCSICGYEMSYMFRGDKVFYDTGCTCTYNRGDLEPRMWEQVAESYNRNVQWANDPGNDFQEKTKKWLAEQDKLFHFDAEPV